MSTEQVCKEITRFLAFDKPEVLCLTGKWGVGKTYLWKQALGLAIKSKSVALNRYAYVSLFGQNSLDDVRYALFENTVPTDKETDSANPDTLVASLKNLEKTGRQSLAFLRVIPALNSYLSNANRSFFLFVRNQIVCFDDLERAGSGLATKDVLGLISFLKEERQCKVVILLNDEEMESNAAEDFKIQLEKIADSRISLNPLASESAAIAFSSPDNTAIQLKEDCEKLGIVNIRVMEKIRRVGERLEVILSQFDEGVLSRALHSAALFVWSYYQPKEAPSLDFISSFKLYEGRIGNKKEIGDAEKSWRALLISYDFNSFEEFDSVILDGIKRGAFDDMAVIEQAKILDKKIEYDKLDGSFSNAWAKYHWSFDDNANVVLDELYGTFRSAVETVSPINLDATLRIFKDFDRPQQAQELLEYYMAHRSDKARFFDLKAHPFYSEIKDPELRAAFAQRFSSMAEHLNIGETLKRIYLRQGWELEELDFLASLAVDDYVKLFKRLNGDDLRFCVQGAMQFGKIMNRTDAMDKIFTLASDALLQIGCESEINARRVKMYGIDTNFTSTKTEE